MHTKSFAGSIFLATCLLFGGHAMAADATPDQVYQAAQAGRYREAQEMMAQILRDHPNSAKAHFVEAELLGKQGKLQQAQDELNTALRLDPSQNFARPGAVDELRTLIAGASSSRAQGTFAGIPWGLVLGIAALLIVVSLIMRARRRRVYAPDGIGPYGYGSNRAPPPPYGGGPQGSYGSPGGVGPGQAAGGMGSGILGGLATGAAVGAGVVAGEALMNRVLNGGSAGASGSPGNVVNPDATRDASAGNSPERDYDMGGKDFGLRDAGSWDDADATRRLTSDDGGANDGSTGDSGGGWDNGGGWDSDSSSGDGGGGSDDWI